MKNIFVFSVVIFSFWKGFSQIPVYPDAGMWNTFSLEKPINQKFSFVFVEEIRLRENFTRLNLFYTNIGASYKPFEFMKVSFVYRHIDKWIYEQKNFSYRHRLMLDIAVRKKVPPLILTYRHRLQAEERDLFTSDDGMLPEWFSRNKIDVKLDLGKRYAHYIVA